MGLEYSKNYHQCVRCGCTMRLERLKLVRRIDDLLNIDETAFVCADAKDCMRMKLEREELFQRKGLKPFVAVKATDPLKKLKPGKRTKKTLQFFPRLAEARRIAGTKPPKRKRLDPPKEPRR